MKKVLISLLSTICGIFFSLGLVACSNSTNSNNVSTDTLSVIATEGGKTNITSSDAETGTNVTLISSANNGYIFVGWYSEEVLLSSEQIYIHTICTEYKTVKAVFSQITYTVKLYSWDNSLYKTIYCNYGDSIDEDLPHRENTIEALYSPIGWSKSLECITSDMEVYALYSEEKILYNLNISIKGNGRVSGAGKYTHKERVGLVAESDSNSIFVGFYDADNNTVLFSNSVQIWDSDKNIVAVFAEKPSQNSKGYYEIKKIEHLFYLSKNASKNYILLNDLDYSSLDEIERTIYKNYIEAFTGTFDGNGHIIKNLIIDNEKDSFFLSNAGRISNLGLENIKGGFVGYNSGYGTIQDCYIIGEMQFDEEKSIKVGGFVYKNTGSIYRCYSAINFIDNRTLYNSGDSINGFIAENSGTIENCITFSNFFVNKRSSWKYSPFGNTQDNVTGALGVRCYAAYCCRIGNSFNSGGIDNATANSKTFYLNSLYWNRFGDVWNLNNLDVSNGKFPKFS